MKRHGFTIIELLVVVVILGILLGIVTTAAASAIKQARDHKANALCTCLQQGLATYYAQKDRWPGPVGDRLAAGGTPSRSNDEGVNNQTDPDKYILTGSEVRQTVKVLIDEAKNLPVNAVWEYMLMKKNIAIGQDALKAIKTYEKDVMATR